MRDIAGQDVENVLHPFTDIARHHGSGPLVIERGRGVHVFDDEGRAYIEGMAGLWSTSLGFGVEELAQVAAEEMRRLGSYHLGDGKSHPQVVRLATRLLELAPAPFSKVFFTSSGSEANDTQIKLLWHYNNLRGKRKKKKIISRINSYHGSTLGTASLTGLATFHHGFDLPLPFARQTTCPSRFHSAEPGESDEEFSTRLARDLEELIVAEGPETVAGFIAEPVIGSGGIIPPPDGYFAKVQEVLRRHDVRLIDDEVITGFGRLGTYWGAQLYGIEPQSLSCSKALSSGYMPIAAVLLDEELYSVLLHKRRNLGTLGHGFTFGGHPTAAAVALKVLELMEQRDVVGHVRGVAPSFQKRVANLAAHPLVGDARGVGLLGGLHLVADKRARKPLPLNSGVATQCVEAAQRHGLIVRALGDVIALAPPLIIDEDEIAELFARLERALDDTYHWAHAKGIVTTADEG
jgi:4-aminobutyrate--pyruvate transaminase